MSECRTDAAGASFQPRDAPSRPSPRHALAGRRRYARARLASGDSTVGLLRRSARGDRRAGSLIREFNGRQWRHVVANPSPKWQNRSMDARLTLDKAGRIVLPKPIRQKLQLIAG